MIIASRDVEVLKSELKNDLQDLNDLAEKNDKAYQRFQLGSDEYLDLAALSYTLHNMYGVMENALYRIAKAFENNLNPSSWHKDLLNRMVLDIDRIRPAVISRESFKYLDDLRGFRHVFRNLYNRGLDSEKVLLLQKKIPETMKSFINDIEKFNKYLNTIIQDLSD